LEIQNRSLEVPFRRHTAHRNQTKLRGHLPSMVFRQCALRWTRNDAWRLRCSARPRLPVSGRVRIPSTVCEPLPSSTARTRRLPIPLARHTKPHAAWRSPVRFRPLPVPACQAPRNGLYPNPQLTVPKILRKAHERSSGCKLRLLRFHPLSEGAMPDHRRPECAGRRLAAIARLTMNSARRKSNPNQRPIMKVTGFGDLGARRQRGAG
jgi:hypothetical protein